MRIVCISDTHNLHSSIVIPDGDILLHSGDSTRRGTESEIRGVNSWLGALPHKHKVIISGNHDFGFQTNPFAKTWITNATYLYDSEITVEGVRIYGSPWQPWFYDWAFNLERGTEISKVWQKIPNGIDILMTHGPPMGIMDQVAYGGNVGCEELAKELVRIKPKVHVFGHIHEGYGELKQNGIHYVNASSCNVKYQPINPPIVIDL